MILFDHIDRKRYLLELALFTAFAATIYLAEMLIPRPLPFLKLGLANIAVLLILLSGHWLEAFIVGIAKILIGGMITGTLISPTTVLALGGSIVSILVMLLFLRVKLGFSVPGISILGAVSHNAAQIFLVRMILIRDDKIFYLTPLLIVMGIVTGLITGFLAGRIFVKLDLKVA